VPGADDRSIREWKNRLWLDMLENIWRTLVRKQASSTAENLVSIRVPKKLMLVVLQSTPR